MSAFEARLEYAIKIKAIHQPAKGRRRHRSRKDLLSDPHSLQDVLQTDIVSSGYGLSPRILVNSLRGIAQELVVRIRFVSKPREIIDLVPLVRNVPRCRSDLYVSARSLPFQFGMLKMKRT